MKSNSQFDPAAFESMLVWLNTDREAAGAKYEQIRQRLVRLFIYRGCTDPESLTDLVFDRVMVKIDETVGRFEGDPLRHFLAVANFIYLESRKKPFEGELPETIAAPVADDTGDQRFDCLNDCLGELPSDRRRIVLEYYRHDKRAKIELRQRLAESYGVTLANLHSKVFRIRAALQQCVEKCVARAN